MNNTVRNILSVVAGVITGFCIGAVLIYATVMSISKDDGIGGTLLFLFIGVFIPTFCSGAVCGYIATGKPYLNLLATSISLILLLLINNDFKNFTINIEAVVGALLATVFVFIGGELGMMLRKRQSA